MARLGIDGFSFRTTMAGYRRTYMTVERSFTELRYRRNKTGWFMHHEKPE